MAILMSKRGMDYMKHQLFGKNLSSLFMAVIGVAWLTTQPIAFAAPSVGNVPYQAIGKIDGINMVQKQIVIGDRAYILADNVSILVGNKTAPKGSLKRGMKVGFNITGSQNQQVIKEIWILPK